MIGTNASGLPLEALADGLSHPERFVGVHWFQPADVFPTALSIGASQHNALLLVWPCLALVTVNRLCDALRDVFDPRMSARQ